MLYNGIYNYAIPHNNIYESFIIVMLLENIQNINRLRRIIQIFRPSTTILSHLLRFVVYDYNKEIILMLLSCGADPNIELNNQNDIHYKTYFILDRTKKLPLFTDIILSTKQYKIIKLFLESGKVDINKCNTYYITPAIASAMIFNIKILELILEYDTTNINYHQFCIKKFYGIENIDNTLGIDINYQYTYCKFVNSFHNLDEINYKLNIFELVLLLQPYSMTHILNRKYKLGKYTPIRSRGHIFKNIKSYLKKYSNKYNHLDILDICYLLIQKGININKIFKNNLEYKLSRRSPHIVNIPTCFDILISDFILNPYQRTYYLNQLLLYMIKNGLYLDNNHITNPCKYMEFINLAIDHYTYMTIKKKFSIFSCIKKNFKSKHTINDFFVLQKICDDELYKNYFSVDLVNKVKENIYRIRYDKYINRILSNIRDQTIHRELKEFFIL